MPIVRRIIPARPPDQALTAARAANTSSVYGPSVASQATVAPGLFSDGDTFFAPGVSAILTPALYASSEIFFALTVSVTLTPAFYTDADAFYTSVVAGGVVDVTPGFHSDSDDLYAPAVTAFVALAPPRLDDDDAFYAARVDIALAAALYANNSTFHWHTLEGGEERRGADSWIIPVNRRRRRGR